MWRPFHWSARDWHPMHEEFFTDELSSVGLAFREDMPVVCEEFELMYKPSLTV